MSEVNPLFAESQIRSTITRHFKDLVQSISADGQQAVDINALISSVLTEIKSEPKYNSYKVILNATFMEDRNLQSVNVRQARGSLINTNTDGTVDIKLTSEELGSADDQKFIVLFQLFYIKA